MPRPNLLPVAYFYRLSTVVCFHSDSGLISAFAPTSTLLTLEMTCTVGNNLTVNPD